VTSLLSVSVVLAILLSVAGLATAGPLARPHLQGGAPTVVSYQGQVVVNDVAYTGTGYFKFAVVNAAGNTSYWSNDGTSAGGSAPTNAVSLTVSYGLFNVLLGDTTLTNMTQALTASVFDGTDRYLRVWFSSSAGGPFTQLSPDRRFAAVPYALQAEEAKNADLLDGNHASAFQQHYANVVVAKSGGDYTTITAALNSITDASDTNRYLVKVMPGVYTEQVTMKQYVDIEGAGELTTKITYTGSASDLAGTVVGANNAELRFLTVENTGGAMYYATAIYNASASPRLTHITVTASGGTVTRGMYNRSSSSPTMTNVTATASGGTLNFGVSNSSSSPTMTNVTATGSGGIDSRGVYNYSSSPTMTNVTATASGGGGNYGVYNGPSSPTIQNSTISASGGTSNYGIYNTATSGTYTVTVNNSQITGSTNTIRNDSEFTVRVGASLLDGGAVSAGGGTVTCAGVYDENYVFYASTCP